MDNPDDDTDCQEVAGPGRSYWVALGMTDTIQLLHRLAAAAGSWGKSATAAAALRGGPPLASQAVAVYRFADPAAASRFVLTMRRVGEYGLAVRAAREMGYQLDRSAAVNGSAGFVSRIGRDDLFAYLAYDGAGLVTAGRRPGREPPSVYLGTYLDRDKPAAALTCPGRAWWDGFGDQAFAVFDLANLV